MEAERTVSRAEVKELIDAMSPLMRFMKADPLMNFTVPVGPYSSANVEFHGPFAADQIDALILQLQTIRTFHDGREGADPLTKQGLTELLDQMVKRIFERGEE